MTNNWNWRQSSFHSHCMKCLHILILDHNILNFDLVFIIQKIAQCIEIQKSNAFDLVGTNSNLFLDINNILGWVNIDFVKLFTNFIYLLVLMKKINYFTHKRRGNYANTLQPERQSVYVRVGPNISKSIFWPDLCVAARRFVNQPIVCVSHVTF